MIVRRREDGVVEIQRATDAHPGVHPALLRVLLLSFAAMVGLAAVLELFPRGALLTAALVVLAAVLATVLIVGWGGERSVGEDSDLAWLESEIPADIGEPSKRQGGTMPDAVVTGQTHEAGKTKSDQPAKPEPGKQPDAKQTAKPAGQQPSKGKPPKKTEPPSKMEPKGNKPASKSAPEARRMYSQDHGASR